MGYNQPKRGVEYKTYVSLISRADGNVFQSSPTLAAGDVKIVKDGNYAGIANLATLPVAIGGKLVEVTVSVSEMTADNVTIIFSDAAGDQWCDLTLNIQTVTRQGDDLQPEIWSAEGATVNLSGTTVGTVAALTGYVAPLDAAGTRSAVGLASANIDVQLAALAAYVDTEMAAALAAILAVKTKTDNLPASPAAVGSAMTLESDERDSIAAALLDLTNGVETSLTMRQAMRVFHAVLAGKMTVSVVGDTATINFRDKADGKNRVTVTFDTAADQRTAVTFDLT